MRVEATGGGAGVRIPEELQGSIPRDVRLTRGGVALAAIATAMTVGAVVAAILMSIAYQRDELAQALREREAVTIQADVAGVRVTRGDHPRRIFTYRYEAGGRLYTGSASVNEKAHRDMKAGSPIDIAYLPSEPGTSWMIGHEPGGMPLVAIVLVPLGLLFGASVMALVLRWQWVLLMEGRPALARVVAHKRVHRDKHRAYSVSYEFETMNGAMRTGSFEVGKNPPPVGSLVPIVYHRDNPRRTGKYPFSLVRPARSQNRIR